MRKKKGFLLMDGVGNTVYVPPESEAAKLLSNAVTLGRKDIIVKSACIKTAQRKLVSDYIKAYFDEDVMNAWKESLI